jgi:hypothetical protein
MSPWTPTIAKNTSSKATGADAPNSHSMEKAMADRTTDDQAARPVAPITPPELAGNILLKRRNAAYPPYAGTIAMFRTL